MVCDSVMVQIHEKKGRILYGKLWHASMKEPVAFAGVGEMVIKMEAICDRVEGQSADEVPRFLNKEMECKYWRMRKRRAAGRALAETRAAAWGWPDLREVSAAKTLLVVDVRLRKNCSMQGTVRGPLTNGEYVGFRSALELMRMIDLIEA